MNKILLIGAGKMGGALLNAWQHSNIEVVVVDKKNSTLDAIDFVPETIILAVKPQAMDELLVSLTNKFGNAPLYISIAAGKTISYFEKNLGDDAKVIRTMPNTPALIGKGITALYANKNVSELQKQIADKLFLQVGEIVWLEDENLINAVTAISGSGPAYIFLLLESIISAGVKNGLPEDVCKQLSISTLIGSAELAKLSPKTLGELRNNVTSKGGTTEAALNILMKDDVLKSLFASAIDSAINRAKELA